MTRYPLPDDDYAAGIISGRHYVWATVCCYNAVVRIDPKSGERHFYNDGRGGGADRPTLGPNGAIWFTEDGPGAAVVRLDPSGKFDHYQLPSFGDHWLGQIIMGPDHALWFLDVGAIADSGEFQGSRAVWRFDLVTHQFKRFPLPGGTDPDSLASADGSIWITETNGWGYIRRLAPNGKTIARRRVDGFPNDIIRGPDKALWFGNDGGGVGRIDFKYRAKYFALPGEPLGSADGIAMAAKRVVWYTDGTDGAVGFFKPHL